MKAKQKDTGVIYEITQEHYELYKTDFEIVGEEMKIEEEIPTILVESSIVKEEEEDKPKGKGRPKK